MSLQINMNSGASAQGGVGVGLMTAAGNPWTVPDALAAELVNRGVATAYNWPANNTGPLTTPELGQIRGVVSGAGVLWANRPSAAANPGALISVTDLGGQAGALFRSDGANWYAVGGRVSLLNRVGSAATPVASLVSAGAAILMGAPLAGLKIPTGLIIPGRSRLVVEGYWVKTGSAAGIGCTVTLGKTNSFSDAQFGGQFIGAAATAIWRQCTEMFFDSTTTATETYVGLSVGGASGAAVTSVRTTNIDTTADMFMNWGTVSSTAGDGLQLYSVAVSLFQ